MLRGDTQKFLKGDIERTHREAETGDKEGIKSLQPNCVCVCVVCVLCVCVSVKSKSETKSNQSQNLSKVRSRSSDA